MNTVVINITHALRKRIFYILGGLFAVISMIPSISLAQFGDTPFPYDIQGETYEYEEDQEINIATIVKEDTNEPTSLLQKFTDIFRLSGRVYDDGTSKATNYVKWILNILLGLVSFLSFVMIIFAFYLIFFSKGDEAVGKAKKILIGVGIALAIMGLAWFIASFFFDIYQTVT